MITIPFWLFLIIVFLSWIIPIIFQTVITKKLEMFFEKYGKLIVTFTEDTLFFTDFKGGIPLFNKISREDNPTSAHLLLKLKFVNKSEMEKTIYNFNIVIFNDRKLIKPKNCAFSINENGRNINNFTVNNKMPIYLKCNPLFEIEELKKLNKTNAVIFSYSFGNKTKMIKTKIKKYITDKGNIPLY